MVCKPFFSTVFIAYTDTALVSIPELIVSSLEHTLVSLDSSHHQRGWDSPAFSCSALHWRPHDEGTAGMRRASGI